MDRITNEKVLNRINAGPHFMIDMVKRNVRFAGHVLRSSGGASHLQIIKGKVVGKTKVGCPRRTWMKDIVEWRGLGT